MSNWTKHSHVNSNYSNVVDCSNWTDAIVEDTSSFYPTLRNVASVQSSLFRCGYCHQTSNWKHVIEVRRQDPFFPSCLFLSTSRYFSLNFHCTWQRHCRLVHNTPAFIEKYSDEDECFKPFTPVKRRVDFTTQIIPTTLNKKSKDDNGAEKTV